MKIFSKAGAFIILVLAIVLAVGGVYASRFIPGLSFSSRQSSSMVNYLEKVNEQVFLNVGIAKVETQTNTTFLPFSEKEAIIVLNYKAKLGIKEPAKIEKTGDKSYKITVPDYEVIGVELDQENPYDRYDGKGGLLSFTSQDIDTGALATAALTDEAQKTYLDKYTEELNESATNYYETVFKSVGDDIQVEVITPDAN